MYYGDAEFQFYSLLYVLFVFVIPAIVAVIVLRWVIGRGKRAIDAKVAIMEREARKP